MQKLMALTVAAIFMPLSSAIADAHHDTADTAVTVTPVDLRELAAWQYTYSPTVTVDAPQEPVQQDDSDNVIALAALNRPEPFGKAGTMRLNFHGAYGVHIKSSDNQFGLLGAGLSYFIVENLSLDGELNGMYIDQDGPNAWAGNFNLLFRWHFHSEETWSVYLDGGAGLFFATKRVPEHGTHFNFTPQAGAGVSFEVAPDIRMMLGIRWHHISNANTSSNNPGRDSVMGYVGLSLPF